MCGVLGLLTQGSQAEDLKNHFSAALKRIDHRGPDACGEAELLSGRLRFGHTRLSILDLSDAGAQPMSSAGGNLTYNGEIYNHQELRGGLQHTFLGHSDTETLLAGLNQYGITFLDKCRGMFAGAYFEGSGRKLYLFRDPIGIKPLYYAKSRSRLCFGSEIKAMLPLIDGEAAADPEVVHCYLNYENYPQEKSLFSGIVGLQPGEILEVDVETLKLSSRRMDTPWGVLDHTPSPSDILGVLRDSVEAHLLSDVPVAVYMSGGLDTSTVTTLAANKDSSITGFTGYFDVGDTYYDETDLAELVAKKLGIGFHKISITANDFKKSFEKLIYHLDEPRMGMGSFSQYVVAQKVAETHKTILSGHGGDELFAGYPKFKAAYLMSKQFSVSNKLAMVRNIKSREIPLMGYALANRMVSGAMPAAPRIYESFENDMFDSQFQVRGRDTIKGVHDYYLNIYLPGLLMVEDRISMAHSLETRVPLLDQRVISAALSVPMEKHLEGGVLKSYMKKAVRDILPSELLGAPKRGFPTPLRVWFRKELLSFLKEQLLEDFRLSSFISRPEVEDLIDSQRTPHRLYALDERRAHRIWMLLCLNVWARKYEVSF